MRAQPSRLLRRLLFPLSVTAFMYACDGPVVARRPAEVPDVPGYGDELRALELNPPMLQEPRPYTGSGSYPRWSPDGMVAAVTTEARGNAQTVNIWDARTEHLRPLISIEEFDP